MTKILIMNRGRVFHSACRCEGSPDEIIPDCAPRGIACSDSLCVGEVSARVSRASLIRKPCSVLKSSPGFCCYKGVNWFVFSCDQHHFCWPSLWLKPRLSARRCCNKRLTFFFRPSYGVRGTLRLNTSSESNPNCRSGYRATVCNE